MRDKRSYGERREWRSAVGYGSDVSVPIEGYYKIKMRAGGVVHAVHLFYGPPSDPITGDVLDRSLRWQASLDDGSLADFDDVWPKCAASQIDESEWLRYVARCRWAKENASASAYADPRKKHDLFSIDSPLPF